jgi:hypothetical protein
MAIGLDDITAILVQEGLDWDQTSGWRKFPAGPARRLARKIYVALPPSGGPVKRIDLSGFGIEHTAFRPKVGPRRDNVQGRIDCKAAADVIRDALRSAARAMQAVPPAANMPDAAHDEPLPEVQASRADIERWMETRLGYGREAGRAWFLGMEESCHCADELDARLRGAAVEDLEENLGRIGCYQELLEDEPNLQPTWRPLILAWLVATTGRVPSTAEVRSYQRHRWGRPDADHLLVELMPLPSPDTQSWAWTEAIGLDRPAYIDRWRPKRIEYLADRWRRVPARPRVAVAYGKTYWPFYKKVFGLDGDGDGESMGADEAGWARGYVTQKGGVVLVQHPVAYGGSNREWEAVGRWLGAVLARP